MRTMLALVLGLVGCVAPPQKYPTDNDSQQNTMEEIVHPVRASAQVAEKPSLDIERIIRAYDITYHRGVFSEQNELRIQEIEQPYQFDQFEGREAMGLSSFEGMEYVIFLPETTHRGNAFVKKDSYRLWELHSKRKETITSTEIAEFSCGGGTLCVILPQVEGYETLFENRLFIERNVCDIIGDDQPYVQAYHLLLERDGEQFDVYGAVVFNNADAVRAQVAQLEGKTVTITPFTRGTRYFTFEK